MYCPAEAFVVLCVVYLATLPSSVVSKQLREQGSHVCPYACGVESYRHMYREKYKKKCGWWGWSRCTAYRIKYRTEYRDVMCYKCCPGWKKAVGSDQCLIPSDKGCGPVPCQSSGSDCWECCAGWSGHDCQTDIDECATNNGGCSHTCVNTAGSYRCDCPLGYTLDPWDPYSSSCVDVDECETYNGGCGDRCSNTQGSFSCSCSDGYRLQTQSLQCIDIDECAEGNGGCSDYCVNTDGDYHCECPSGYEVDASGFSCKEINQCEHQNGGCDHICVKVVGSFHCECTGGHILAPDSFTCQDINECAANNGKCSDICVNSAGSYVCDCPTGYHLDESGFDCTDINECSSGNGGCSDTCINTAGSFYCDCPNGFALDDSKRDCRDINECSEQTDNCQQICRNTIGSFECVCESGYEKKHETLCTDIDECVNLNGGCSDTCVNTIGSYTCECPDGWQVLQGSLKCTDANECLVNNGDCEQRCINTQGSFFCDCYHGYQLDEQDHLCHDVNECSTVNGGCREGCRNTDGSFVCTCPSGYQLASDGFRCEDSDECSSDENLCQHTCENTAGSYTCACMDGYEQRGDDCIDIDECLESVCEYSCTNSAGSFLCGCPDGMFLDTNGITCSEKNVCAEDHGCQQICNSEHNSVFCSCLSGFELINDKECTDIDECSRSDDGCSHDCSNTNGSYVCHCPVGLQIDSDMRTCLDPCLPNPCLHEGVCARGESGAVCDCSRTSYTGDRCQQGVVNVSVEGDVYKGREASMIFVAKPDSSLEIEVNVVGSKVEVTPLKASIAFPSEMATVKIKGLEAGFETVQFSLSGIAASQYVQPERVTVYVHDVFSRNNITDFTLPSGTYGLEANLQDKIDVVFTSTKPWYSLVGDPDITFTLGIVHMEAGGLKVPISFRGTEMRKGDLPRPVSSFRSEEDGTLQSRRQRRSSFQSLLKEDIEDLWAHNAIFRTALKLLRPHLPSWLSLEICGDPVYDVIPRTDIMPGLQTKGVPSCSGAPVFDDHLYVVIEIRTDLCFGVLDNEVTIDASSERHVCLLVDLDTFPGSTIIIMLPEDSSAVLQKLKLFSTIKDNYGVTINVRGWGFSLANGLNVKDYKFSKKYWIGDRYFTAPTVDDASVWLDVSGEYEKKFGMMELKGAGRMELALTAPDLAKLVTQPMHDRVRLHLGAKAGLLGISFNVKQIRIPLEPQLDAEMRAYAAVGGGEGFAHEKCGSDPTGIFLSCKLAFNPFNDPILEKFLTSIDLSVSANVFATTDLTVTENSVIPSEIEAAIQEMSDMVITLISQLNARIHTLIGIVSRFLQELLSLTKTETDKIERLISDVVLAIEYNNFASLLDAFTISVTGMREVIGEINDVIGALSHCVEAHALGIIDDMKSYVTNILQLLSQTQWLIIQQALSAQGGVNGLGIQFSGTLEIYKLAFPQLDMEFVYSNGSLGQCSRFNEKFSLLQGQEAFRIMGFVRKPMKKARFFKAKKGVGVEFAYGLDTGDVVATFLAKWSLLGFEVEAEAYVAKKYIGANMVAKLYSLFTIEAEVHAPITKEMRLFVKATFLPGPEGFDGSLKDAIYLAAESLADGAEERLSQVQRGLETAREEMQKGINWLNKKQDQVDDLNEDFDNAVEKLREANRKVADTQKVVDDALEGVRGAERELDRICKIRDCGRVCFPGLKCRRCLKGWLKWIPCSCRWTSCMIKIPDVTCHGKNAACYTVRGLAFGALQVAKVGLYAARVPFEAAKLGLTGVELLVDKSRIVLDIAKVALEAAKVVLKGLQTAAEVAEDAVEMAKHVLRGALKIAALLLDVILPIDIRRCGFTVELSTEDLFVFSVDCEMNLFRTGWLDFNFTINFGDFWQSMVSFARELVKEFASRLGLDRRKRDTPFWQLNGGNNTESKVWLHKMDFANGLTQDEIKIQEYAGKCEKYESLAKFLSTSVDLLLEAVNDIKTTVDEMEAALESLQAMPYNSSANITLDDADIDADEASREYNLTRYEIEAAVNESVAKITESDMFKAVEDISSWNKDLIRDQMADIAEYQFIAAWKNMMQNITQNYFDKEECLNFFDCVIVSFIDLHLLYDGLDLPGSNTTRMMIREVEQQFVDVMLNSTSATLNEAYTFSHDVLVLLEKMNKTKVFCASPPVMVTSPKNASVLTGHSFQLTCEATADPEPAYSWMRDDELLEGHESNQLSIDHVSKLDAGDYTCIATNHLSSTKSVPARVTVEWSPEIDASHSESLEVLMGFQDEVVLVCNVSASPEAIITWYKEDTGEPASILSLQPKSVASDYYIRLPSVSDSGKYWCRAENKYGTAISNTIDLTVRHVVVPTITTTIHVGILVTQRTVDISYSIRDLEANITQALDLGHLFGSSVTFRWNEADLSGSVLVHVTLSNDTMDAHMSRQLLKALYRHNLDQSLALIRQIQSAAYAEREVLVSDCCRVTYDPSKLFVEGPHTSCPILYEKIDDDLCAKVLQKETLITTEPSDATSVPATASTKSNDSNFETWVLVAGTVGGIPFVALVIFFGWCKQRRVNKGKQQKGQLAQPCKKSQI